jgi:hypothetical protein
MDIHLAGSSDTPFSRYLPFAGNLERSSADDDPTDSRPIRMLVAIANPQNLRAWRGLQPVEVEKERDQLQEAILQGAICNNEIELKLLDQPCTLASLEAELKQQRYHVVHFIGHGTYKEKDRSAALLLANDQNEVELVTDQDFADMLARLGYDNLPRLIFLASCQTATRSPVDAQRGFAPTLVKVGVPAVLAMQELVEVTTAQRFTHIFYKQLLQHGQVDLACNEARSALLTGKVSGAGIPALFMHLKDARLWAPNPVYGGLRKMLELDQYKFFDEEKGDYKPLPIEAIHLTGQQDVRSFARIEHEVTAGVDIVSTVQTIFDCASSATSCQTPVIVVAGGYGCNSSTQLRRVVWQTIKNSLEAPIENVVLPVYIDLRDYAKYRAEVDEASEAIEQLVLRSLQPFGPDLTRERPGQLHKLRFVFDQADHLDPDTRRDAFEGIGMFIGTNRDHQYIVYQYMLVDPPFDWRCFDPEGDSSSAADGQAAQSSGWYELHHLILQRMVPHKIRNFLSGLKDKQSGQATNAKNLLECLDTHGLYDIAAVPSFLINMLTRARSGRYLTSRIDILEKMLERAIAKIPVEQGMRANARQVLYALAWEMQSTHVLVLPTTKVRAMMGQIRDASEYYDLERLSNALDRAELLVHVGSQQMRFSYNRLQAYCCAQAIKTMGEQERERVLNDITAQLGHLTYLQWWEETLVFLCGLLANDTDRPPNTLEKFLHKLIYGANLLESEQLFLAARCLLEGVGSLASRVDDLRIHIVTALIWRLRNYNEPRLEYRSQAATLLGQLVPLAPQSYVQHLIHISYEKARADRHGEPDFDYSNVRWAAVVALLRIPEAQRKKLLDPNLEEMFCSWQNLKINQFIIWLTDQTDQSNLSRQCIAALALGDLYAQLSLVQEEEAKNKAKPALDALQDSFLCTFVEPATLWTVTYALAATGAPEVRQSLFNRYLCKADELSAKESAPNLHRKCMAYLIGLLRLQEESAHDFLLKQCLEETDNVALAAVAIDALGHLGDKQDKECLEQVALGNFECYLPNISCPGDEDVEYLQHKAINALASVGDLDTIHKFHKRHSEANGNAQTRYKTNLEQAFYRMSVEIYRRLDEKSIG